MIPKSECCLTLAVAVSNPRWVGGGKKVNTPYQNLKPKSHWYDFHVC